MKCVLVHGYYQQRGGEDEVFEAEAGLLRAHGHRVTEFTAANEEMVALGAAKRAAVTVWNRRTHERLARLLREVRPDVVHFHNTFPLVSPSAYYTAAGEGIPVVQTLHNYRLLCPNGLFFRDGGVCEDCLGKPIPWPGVVHACYRDSVAASAVTAGMLTAHRLAGTWTRKVDLYIALTDFARRKFVAGGLPRDRIFLKPNFVPDPGPARGPREDFALFVGRLTPEKGVRTMLRAWRRLRDVPLRIVGTGPLSDEVAAAIADREAYPHVQMCGFQRQDEVLRMMKRARFLVFPSEWYEGAPRVVLEAFACGLPVIGARMGALAELVEEGRTGWAFEPGHPDDLVRCVTRALATDGLVEMGKNARRDYEVKYDPGSNHTRLLELYRMAGARAREVRDSAPAAG